MSSASAQHVIARAVDITKNFGSGDARTVALAGVTVGFPRGEFTAIMGASGSGKSTFLHCMAGLEPVTSGSVYIGGTDITALSDKQLTRLRRKAIGFVFQAFNLVPALTALENITLQLDLAKTPVDQAWLDQVIDTVALRAWLHHRPGELSGGQQQRVACARALASKPEIIFADEPTGNLDSRASADVLALLRRSVTEFGQTLVMVTHDAAAASHADRVLFLADGRMVDDLARPSPADVLEKVTRLEMQPRG